MKFSLFIVTILFAGMAEAHGGSEEPGKAHLLDILGGGLLAISWLLYLAGTKRIPATFQQKWLFHGASLAAILIILASLHGWMDRSAAWHMAEHMWLMTLIVPLYLLSRPLPQWLAVSGRVGRKLFKSLFYLTRNPIQAAFIHAIAIWLWHVPGFYNSALIHPGWHFTGHACLVLSASIFWWSVLSQRNSTAFLALLLTMMHTGMLGALLTFSHTLLYLDAHDLQDQQLAGLIMWVPGGLPYLVAGVWFSMNWLKRTASR